MTSTCLDNTGAFFLCDALKERAPKHDGVSLRSYSFQDLDNDGVYELVEKMNQIEEASTGLLNIGLSPAFELVKIYKFKNGKFSESFSVYSDYFSARVYHYQFWKKQILKPVNLSADSKALNKSNKSLFINELDILIREAYNNSKSLIK